MKPIRKTTKKPTSVQAKSMSDAAFDWTADTERSDWIAMDSDEIETMIQDHEKAINALQDAVDVEQDDSVLNDFEDRLMRHQDMVDELTWVLDEDVYPREDRNKKRETDAKLLKKAGFHLATLEDLGKVYRAAKSEYSSSYAMMIDDAHAGAANVCKRLGMLEPCYDSRWFSQMYRYVRAHQSWDKISDDDKEKMLDDLNDEMVHMAAVRVKKRVGKKR